ncbi:MAG: hypothetical protein HOK52_10425 [Candidatus Marinimicrobia bacterium]|nr:hypothetical protein [Candidatus Neomarinimicrobiota bacterium]
MTILVNQICRLFSTTHTPDSIITRNHNQSLDRADNYPSPSGSKSYIDENNLFNESGIVLSYQQYGHPEYR